MKTILLGIIFFFLITTTVFAQTPRVFSRDETYLYHLQGQDPKWRMENISIVQNDAILTISFKAAYRNGGSIPPYFHTLTIDLRKVTIVNGYWDSAYDKYGFVEYYQRGDASRIKISGDIQDRLVIPQYNTDETKTEKCIYFFCSNNIEGDRLTQELLSCQKGFKEPEPQYRTSSASVIVANADNTTSSELYKKIKNYFENYEVNSEVGNLRAAQTKNLRVTFKYPNLIFNFQDSYANGTVYSSVNDKLGKVTLLIPISSTMVKSNGSAIVFVSDVGLEHTLNGKRNLINQYGFYASPLIIDDMRMDIMQFFSAVEREGYKGSYGISSAKQEPTKTTVSNKTISDKFGL